MWIIFYLIGALYIVTYLFNDDISNATYNLIFNKTLDWYDCN